MRKATTALLAVLLICSTACKLNSLLTGTYQVNEISAELPGTAKLTVYLKGTLILAGDNFSLNVALAGNTSEELMVAQTMTGSYSLNGNVVTLSHIRLDDQPIPFNDKVIIVGSIRFDKKHAYIDMLPFKDTNITVKDTKNIKVTLVLSK